MASIRRFLNAECLVACAALLTSTPTFADEPAARATSRETGSPFAPASETNERIRAMTLGEALAHARTHHPLVRAGLARIAAEIAGAGAPRAAWQPVIGMSAQLFAATANNTTGTAVSEPFLDVPRVGGTRVVSRGDWKPHPSTFVGAGATQELFDFGRIAAEIAAADALVGVERQRARADELTVEYDVQEAYFAIFAAKAISKASEEAYQRAQVHRDLAAAGVNAGLRSPIELTRAEADLARFDTGRVRARGNLVTAQEMFAAAVAVPDERLDIADTPPTPADLPSLDRAIEQALRRDPELLGAIAQLEADEARSKAIGAELRPDLSMTATISARAGGAPPSGNGLSARGGGWVPNVPNWDVGVVLSWPLFDGTVSARERASRAMERVRQEEIATVRERDVALIRQAHVAVTVARAALPGLTRSVEAAHANYAQADARFRSGLGTSVELADAETVRTQAEIQLALGEFELARARAAFGRAIAEGL